MTSVHVAAWFDGPNGQLWVEVAKLFHSRQIFRSFEKIIVDAPERVREDGGEFIRWTKRNYVAYQLAGIRRLSGTRRDEVSLKRALLAAKKDLHRRGLRNASLLIWRTYTRSPGKLWIGQTSTLLTLLLHRGPTLV